MTTRNLLSGPVTLSHVVAKDRNMLHALQYPRLKEDFYQRIEGYRPLLAHEVAYHFRIKSSDVNISPQEYWRHGSFNLCVPVMIEVDQSVAPKVPQFVMLRFPLPYRVGEATNPGNSDEKISCEAATYAWLSENCPTVPIPRLYGFGFSTGKRVSVLLFTFSAANCYASGSLRTMNFFPGGRAGSNELDAFFSLHLASSNHRSTYAPAIT